MKITEIRGFHVGFSPSPAIGNARTFIRQRDFLLLQILSDNGISGWGEVFASPHAAGALIQSRFARMVLGQSPLAYGRLWDAMLNTVGYDRRGVAMMAISAIDMALHDIAARVRNVSVAAMLGGALRDRVFAYASGPFIADRQAPYANYGAEVESYLARGFRAVKPRAGADPKSDGNMALALRSIVGDDIGLMVDINQGYTARAAIASARRMERADLLWIEEPVLPEDTDGYRAVAAAVPTAVAGGEALGSLAAFRDFLAAGALSIVQPDMTVCGGYTGFAKVAALAAAYDLPVMPHVFGTAVHQRAALQMAALLPSRRGGGPADFPYFEVDATDNPLLTLGDGLEIAPDGTMAIPAAPGTGLEIDPERLSPWLTGSWRQIH